MEPWNYYEPKFKVGDVIVITDFYDETYRKFRGTGNYLETSIYAMIYEVTNVNDNQYELNSYYLSSRHGKYCSIKLPAMQIDANFVLFTGDLEAIRILYF